MINDDIAGFDVTVQQPTRVNGSEAFRDLGESYLDQVARKRSTTKLVQRLSNVGYDVMLVPKTA